MPVQRDVTPLFPDNILPDPPNIDEALARLGGVIRDRRPKISEIKDIVAEYYNTTTLDIDGPLRNMNLVFARHVFWYFARRFNGMSMTEIGRRCGGYDHTSVRHGVQRIERLVLQTPLIADELESLRLKIAERVLLRNGRIRDAADN